MQKNLSKFISSEEYYLKKFGKIESNQKVIKELNDSLSYIAYKTQDIGYNIIRCDIFSSSGFVIDSPIRFIKKIKSLDRRVSKCHISMSYSSKIKDQFEKMGFLKTAIVLAAKVQDSYLYLSRQRVLGFHVGIIKKNEIQEVLVLEKMAHENSTSSRVRKFDMKKANAFYHFLCRRKSCFVAYDKNAKVVGSIGFRWDDNYCGYIMCIAVHPEYQGMGIAKILYLEVMKVFIEKKVECYFGNTTTTQVLSLAKKMKRKPIGIVFEC